MKKKQGDFSPQTVEHTESDTHTHFPNQIFKVKTAKWEFRDELVKGLGVICYPVKRYKLT